MSNTISLPWRSQQHNNGPFIQSSLTPNEMRALQELCNQPYDNPELPPAVLEIGSAYGFSSIGMALAGARVVSVDHHTHMPSKTQMERNIRAYGVNRQVTMVVKDSRDALPLLPDDSFDGAFIDGDHSFSGCTFDIRQCLRLVKSGGWIAIHDYNEESCKEVCPAVDEVFGVHAQKMLIDTLYIIKVHYVKKSSTPLLTIATLTIPGREKHLQALQIELASQIGSEPVEHLIEEGPERYGTKMRRSIERASGEYICWVDDDDMVHPDYVLSILDAIRNNPNVGVVTFGSQTPGCEPAWLRFGHHDDSGYIETRHGKGRVKSANHYCAWQRDVAASAPWLHRNYGAELAWYTALRKIWHGKITEHHIQEILHIYCYDPDLTRCQDRPSIDDSLKDGGTRVAIWKHKDGSIVMSTGWDRDAKTHKVQWPSGFILTVPLADLSYVDEIIYK